MGVTAAGPSAPEVARVAGEFRGDESTVYIYINLSIEFGCLLIVRLVKFAHAQSFVLAALGSGACPNGGNCHTSLVFSNF